MNGGKWNAQLNIGCKEDALGFLKVFFFFLLIIMIIEKDIEVSRHLG